MKLNEVYSKPLKDVIEALELSDMKVHTDEGGNVKAIELKYTEKKAEPEPGTQNESVGIEGRNSHVKNTEQKSGTGTA